MQLLQVMVERWESGNEYSKTYCVFNVGYMYCIAFHNYPYLDVEFRIMIWDAVIFFGIVYGYTFGMIAFAIISHKINGR